MVDGSCTAPVEDSRPKGGDRAETPRESNISPVDLLREGSRPGNAQINPGGLPPGTGDTIAALPTVKDIPNADWNKVVTGLENAVGATTSKGQVDRMADAINDAKKGLVAGMDKDGSLDIRVVGSLHGWKIKPTPELDCATGKLVPHTRTTEYNGYDSKGREKVIGERTP